MATYERENGSSRLRTTAMVSALAVIVIAGFVAIVGGSSRDTAVVAKTTVAVAEAPPSSSATAPTESATTTVAAPVTTATPTVLPCPTAKGPNTQTTKFSAPPPDCLEPGVRYRAKIKTDQGTIWVLLNADKAPQTVNNFVYLARYSFYDGMSIHRVISDFLIQTGSPTPDGEGGPGYVLSNSEGATDPFKPGTVAMADRGNGSQFFIISGSNGASLNPAEYAPLGTVTQGLDVVKKINALATAKGTASQLVTIRSLEIVADGGSGTGATTTTTSAGN
jgi:cyclophilin family peptidyl-prolyl cis-trans isomerase